MSDEEIKNLDDPINVPIPPISTEDLVTWVTALVDSYELWTKIPACWAEHPGVVRELSTLWRFALAIQNSDSNPVETARMQLEWQNDLGQMIERLSSCPAPWCPKQGASAGPIAECLKAGYHRHPPNWDPESSYELRAKSRQELRDSGAVSQVPPAPSVDAKDFR